MTTTWRLKGLAHPPFPGCPKCGQTNAFDQPQYYVKTWYDRDQEPYDGPEVLRWPCRRCRYAIESQPLDAPQGKT